MQETSRNLQCARLMPELKHKVGEGDFDITKSEVCKWLIQQPEILNYLFDRVSIMTKSKGDVNYG